MRAAIYCRVSTFDQTTLNQELELRAVAERKGFEVVEVYRDVGISGAKGRDKRPALDALLKDATRRRFDIVMAWSVDRLGRSLQDLVGFLAEIHGGGVDLYLHQQAIDTTTPAGKALFGMLGVFAEFERSIIVARVRSGIRRAQERGTKSGKAIGRPKTATAVREMIVERRAKGESLRKIAAATGVSIETVRRLSAAPVMGERAV
jgi:DNA invertase Pin-like site-specific DNA recombinase